MTEEAPTPRKTPARKATDASASKPAASKPASSKPAASKPAASKPAASKPVASKPASAKKTVAAKAAPAAKATSATKAAPAAKAAPPVASSTAAPTAPPVTPPPAPPVTAPPATSSAPAPVAPQPMLESDARMWAMLTHILALVALFVSGGMLAFLVPLIVWLVFRERSVLIDYHAKQNLNLQLTLLVVSFAGILIGFVIFFGAGFILTGPLMLAYFVYAVVISIIAGVRANAGEYYRIPAVINFVK